jgi:hypothetical protein
MRRLPVLQFAVMAALVSPATGAASETPGNQRPTAPVDVQPLAAQVRRIVTALTMLGEPLSATEQAAIETAAAQGSAERIEQVLDAHCLWVVRVPMDGGLQVQPGAAAPELVEQGWRTFLSKVQNDRGTRERLRVTSPNAQSVSNADTVRSESDRAYRNRRPGVKLPSVADGWLDLEEYETAPLQPNLGGLPIEYRVVQLSSRDPGERHARFSFGFAAVNAPLGVVTEIETRFTARTARTIALRIVDEHGQPTTAALEIRDSLGRVYPSLGKRLAPDFAFQPQVYRTDGESIRLPDGEYQIECHRGPESLFERQAVKVTAATKEFAFKIQRWIDPAAFGWWSGDHHIHAAGCAHYSNPAEGVTSADMVRQTRGEDLKVGATLTWGPGFDYQKQFFTGAEDAVSRYPYLLRYDVEVSGFGSERSGHLCLLDLHDENYPGTTSTEHWPTFGLNIIRWAKAQGALVGAAHSGWGLQPAAADESRRSVVQNSGDLRLATTDLPNYVIPPYNGIGANEYIVDVTHEVPGRDGRLVPAMDFMALVDTPAVWELNMWYHTLNAGFRTRGSGETDFPCIYGERVGVGRSYVKVDGEVTFDKWCDGIRAGRAYVSDGRSHIIAFAAATISDGRAGTKVGVGENDSEIKLPATGTVRLSANVAAWLPETPDEQVSRSKWTEKPYWDVERARIGRTRTVPVEVVVNGYPVQQKTITADGTLQEVTFEVPIQQSSWMALRILPSSHTNPIWALVGDQPVRASRRSVEWCLKGVDQCWSQKQRFIAAAEMPAAEAAYEHAREVYRHRLAECVTE